MEKIRGFVGKFIVDKALKPIVTKVMGYLDVVEDAPLNLLIMASLLPTCFDYTVTGPQAHAKPNIPAIKEYTREVKDLWLSSQNNL